MKIILLLSILFVLLSCNKISEDVSLVNLKCEYLENPIGIDSKKPRFTWQMITERPGALQKAFQLFVGTDSLEVAEGEGHIWESGGIASSTIPVVYSGAVDLKPFTRYYWGVKVRDERGEWSNISPVAFFETGMMEQENWKGCWITDGQENPTESWNNDPPDQDLKKAPYYRKSFSIDRKVKSARAYIAVAGLYEFSINGNKIGDRCLDPMFTRFDRRTLYVTYDVTKNLQEGENVIGVLLGNGWYNLQSKAVWYFDRSPWRARPKFCMDLRINYEDGPEEVIRTGQEQGWKTSLSPVIFNSIYTGEHYDARLDQPGWNKPGFDDSGWSKPKNTGAPSQNIVAQCLTPIRIKEEIPAKEIIQLDDHTYVFDFGRNISGVTKIKAKGERGTKVYLKHAELLDETGHADISNIDVHYRPIDNSDPFQTDIFILSGAGEETFMPRFNYKGFQYVEVISDNPIKLTKESLVAYFMHSDVPEVGSIRASNPLIEKIWNACNVSYLSNLFGYPTDCPQREKNGWNGDSHINTETGLYNFDGITVYEKWMADFRDEQQSNGLIPAIIPTSGWGYHWGNGPDWTSTIAIIPWTTYLFYGDSKLLEDCYDNIRRYVDYIDENWPTGLVDWGLGDWLPVKAVTTREFTSTAYFFVDATILSKTAELLGKYEDYKKYKILSEKIKQVFNQKYLDPKTGTYGQGYQTELSFALHWRLVPDSLREKVVENLGKQVIADDYHVNVGLQGTKTILNALSENGYADLAYKAATQDTYPSWGWWIVNGATTFHENWPLETKSDLSLNHIGFGEINAWFYKALGGIFPDEENPGFKNVILKPNFVKKLDRFEAKHEGPYGTIVSSWEKTENGIRYHVTIPPNSTATLYLRAEKVLENGKELSKNKYITNKKNRNQSSILQLQSGKYQFLIIE